MPTLTLLSFFCGMMLSIHCEVTSVETTIHPARQGLNGILRVPSDKSISHRALMFGGLAQGKSVVRNLLLAEDTLSTGKCLQDLGVGLDINVERAEAVIEGRGLDGWQEPANILDCGNSGTTMRLLCGALAGMPFYSVLTGDASLRSRPMARVAVPLSRLGAQIDGRAQGRFAPLGIRGNRLQGGAINSGVASAQVKSALLLAGLHAREPLLVTEPLPTRDHSERLLAAMGAKISAQGNRIELTPGQELQPLQLQVPSDISSAAFWLVAASIVPDSRIELREVGINPTRSGIIEILRAMGGRIEIRNQRLEGGEPVADLIVASATLSAVSIAAEQVPLLIDEIPVLAVAMAVAAGESKVSGAGELRVKESDRIRAVCCNLENLGIQIQEREDGFVISGGQAITGGRVESGGDHRIAMAMAVAALAAQAEVRISGSEAVAVSYPEFWQHMEQLRG